MVSTRLLPAPVPDLNPVPAGRNHFHLTSAVLAPQVLFIGFKSGLAVGSPFCTLALCSPPAVLVNLAHMSITWVSGFRSGHAAAQLIFPTRQFPRCSSIRVTISRDHGSYFTGSRAFLLVNFCCISRLTENSGQLLTTPSMFLGPVNQGYSVPQAGCRPVSLVSVKTSAGAVM